MKRLQGKELLWVPGVILLFVIFSAARIGVADLLSGYATNEIAAWSSRAAQPDSSSVADVTRALELARWLAPDNPDPYESLAHLALVRSAMPGVNDAGRKAYLKEGLALIHQAISLRPVSPYGWADLLRLKHNLGEYDAEFRHSLERSTTLGPWEPSVQYIVAEAGLNAWYELPGAEQEMVRKNFLRGMKRQAAKMMSIAQSLHKDCDGEPPDSGCRQ